MEPLARFLRWVAEGDQARIAQELPAFLEGADPEDSYELADDLARYGYAEEAVSALRHLLNRFPEEGQLAVDLAGLLLDAGEEDEALELLLAVDEGSEAYVQSLVVQADYYQMSGMHEVADRKIEQALALDPDEPLLRSAKAELLAGQGRYLEAARILEGLYSEAAGGEEMQLVARLAEVYSLGGAYEAAIPHYEQLLDAGLAPDVLFGAAHAHFQTQRYGEAVRLLDALLALDPDYFSAYLLKAQCEEALGETKSALAVAEEGIRRDAYEKEFYLTAGKLALKLQEDRRAERWLREALALDPDYAPAAHALASLLFSSARYGETLEVLDPLLASGDGSPALLLLAARSSEELEQYDRARAYYEAAAPDIGDDIEALAAYARFLAAEGDRPRARALASRLLQLDPENADWIDLQESLQ